MTKSSSIAPTKREILNFNKQNSMSPEGIAKNVQVTPTQREILDINACKHSNQIAANTKVNPTQLSSIDLNSAPKGSGCGCPGGFDYIEEKQNPMVALLNQSQQAPHSRQIALGGDERPQTQSFEQID